MLVAGLCGVAATVLHTATDDISDEVGIPTVERIYNGWINPEDLIPMPQCIAHQDYSAWMRAMTTCTAKRCTSWFIFCIHHQWLTQISCLSTAFSPDIIRGYLPYCSRSVLAKAQLYDWVRKTTGRTWLAELGDANELKHISPVSLLEGYANLDTASKAPHCLTTSRSASTPSKELYEYVLESCSFTGSTIHTGNAARPWEYNESRKSMAALSFDTVGYNLTGRRIREGDYFDKECFCDTFSMDHSQEPCSQSGLLDLTRERLWMHATCGPTSLPVNWKDSLKVTGTAFIPKRSWHWPECLEDIPDGIVSLKDQCMTDACELDSDGYCQVNPAIDAACFCRGIDYDSCRGSCHIFETRINYVEWLHDVCGSVQGWDGLPDDWRRLAAPDISDLIPWPWSIEVFKPPFSKGWLLWSLFMVNLASMPPVLFRRRKRRDDPLAAASASSWRPQPEAWLLSGIFMAVIQIGSHYINAGIAEKAIGSENVTVFQMMLLWSTIPRLGWLSLLPSGVPSSERTEPAAVAAFLTGELILQLFSLGPMINAVKYGFQHDIMFRKFEGVEKEYAAQAMYVGAFLWLVIAALQVFYLLLVLLTIGSDERESGIWDKYGARSEARRKSSSGRKGEGRPLRASRSTPGKKGRHITYGTLPLNGEKVLASGRKHYTLYMITVAGSVLVWTAQWLLWGGFIGLSSGETSFCPSLLEILITGLWMVGALVSAAVSTAS